MADPLQLAKQFVKTVVRMFYETEHIVVIDALVFHGALTISDLVTVLDGGKNQKGAQRITGRLREGGLVSVFTRQEVRVGAMKATNREYYYIDYRRAIDATKYRLHVLDEKIKKNVNPSQEKKDFNCKRCKSQWTALEAMDSPDPIPDRIGGTGFICKNCSYPLDEIADDGVGHDAGDVPAKFNKIFKPILNLMQQIDEVVIPAIEGQDAVDGAIELPRDQELNPAAQHEVVVAPAVRPTAVRGVATGPEKISVSIATNSEQSEAARIAEAQRQAKIQQQNLLPEWHTKSTVRDQDYGESNIKTEATGSLTPSFKTEQTEEKNVATTDLDDIFAKIEADRIKQEEQDETDDEDDEFEDVIVSNAATETNGAPDAKRAKLESSAAPSPANGVTPGMSTGDGGDESDEDEFVDV
ncbi:hypothetical protein BU24DRAFT_449976 [Aaosphaeria arxii CBS 175.79]|uniref:HTH TFE/IIEalpha-type domain-containing protein n=1 Tax=Aaosphaeria arxii CBS 175.79 TaxID=1450172 RepID=A0A6A5XQV2_9PLEO|nr:uncharacterized protein BU24DRAFT_449976 [Aaosphaeria arxii CBS 175.79]KAF2015217.1 hypothetical protein BU24DRAFT_449976 [Aaosphaeria arxii CBS 175.79]